MKKLIKILLGLFYLFAFFKAQAQTFTWTALGSGANERIRAIAVNGANIYVGGDFTSIGGVAANYIAKWNGTSWSALGSGASGTVNAIAIDASGNVYAGGGVNVKFGGTTINSIGKWDGSTWSPLGTLEKNGVDNDVYAITASGTSIYVGGLFDWEYSNNNGEGLSAHKIAKWDGATSTWTNLGYGVTDNNSVNTIVVNGDDIYIGGTFAAVSNTIAIEAIANTTRIARWNTNSWYALGTGANDYVSSMAISGSNLYAGGGFSSMGGVANTYRLAKWNGTIWSSVGTGSMDPNQDINAIATYGNDVYAGGSFLTIGGNSANYIAKWNGSSWLPIGTADVNGVTAGSYISSLAIQSTTGSMIVGGYFTAVNGIENGVHIAKFTDSNNPLPVELTSFTASATSSYVLLKWETATEVNNYGFEIQKLVFDFSNSTSKWEKIAFVQGHGNCNSPTNYSYTDKLATGNLKYRLKQIDFNGQFEYSKVIDVVTEIPTNYSLNQNYPNPFNPVTTISYSIPVNVIGEIGNVKLRVFDLIGKEVASLVNEQQPGGVYQVQFNASNLSSGIYFYTLQSGSFKQTRKLILIK